MVLVLGCGGGGGGHSGPPQEATPQFRAIAGISMGAYGAMNLGTKHPELFGTIASLGGPVDMTQLLRDTAAGLKVAPQTTIPKTIGDPTTFDHQLPYPGRDLVLNLASQGHHRRVVSDDSIPLLGRGMLVRRQCTLPFLSRSIFARRCQ
jgi:S-formylglutathione hydrolase FrmB